MKRIHLVLITAYLISSPFCSSVSWGQPKSKAASSKEAASIEGNVVDATTKQPIVGATVQAKNQAGRASAPQRTGVNGAYRLSLDDARQTYLLIASAAGYEPYEERVAFTTAYNTQLFGKAIRLSRVSTKPTPAPNEPVPAPPAVAQATVTPPTASTLTGRQLAPPKTLDSKVVNTPPLIVAPAGKTTQLRAIQFVQSKADLLPDAQPALEQLLAFMRDKPTVEIELAGHTDNQGDFDENLRLSKQRVDVVKAYLVQNGIAANRITTRGYGPTRPLASNNNEGSRQQNRRVEMKIVKE